jgi:hypothetical protein
MKVILLVLGLVAVSFSAIEDLVDKATKPVPYIVAGMNDKFLTPFAQKTVKKMLGLPSEAKYYK